MATGTQSTSAQSQASYRSSAFEQESWELVGEAPRGEQFVPMQVTVQEGSQQLTDKMFADFGGHSSQTSKERWHLSAQLASELKRLQQREEEDANKHKLTDAELEAIRQEAFNAGRLEGLESAVSTQTERMTELENRLTEVLRDLKTQLDEQYNNIASQAADFSTLVAKRIVGHAVEINPEYIIPLIREALLLSGGANIKKIRVSPQDLEFIEVIGIAKQFKEYDGSWQFEADASVRAGCILESSAGEIDFDIDKAWERVRDNVVKVLR